jgi:hypothetical protein
MSFELKLYIFFVVVLTMKILSFSLMMSLTLTGRVGV